MSLGTLWSHELLSCNVYIDNLTASEHLFQACLNNIVIKGRSSLARDLPANSRNGGTFKWSLTIN